MTFKYGFDIQKHAFYPGKYYITRNGVKAPNRIKQSMQRLGLGKAQKRISQLIKEEDKKCRS